MQPPRQSQLFFRVLLRRCAAAVWLTYRLPARFCTCCAQWNIWGKMNGGAPKAGPGGVAGFTQAMLEQTAEAMVARGLRDVGFVYLNLDCGWTSGHRDANGLQVNTTAFPSMTGLIDKVHSLKMKFGM
jgi:hypothetical protein